MMQLKLLKMKILNLMMVNSVKSYEEIRKEQLEDGQRDESEDRKEEKDIAEDKKKLINLMKKMNQHRQAPNIENLTIQITQTNLLSSLSKKRKFFI